ncbi:MAG: carbon-nitrogen hydrolase family protein [Mojavia pulchra JT2-VF2]|jgi:predicted amidohydrolase|uniref:Carbon-nitrogen hydrolase family protein n=1 Tax=Mojavia pulchra JT2-VF2 TaxID=287848 RepID=A0A951UHF7_9NOST|nr:carbon-nitrogen hydrolase family protein [Mojavia pulchra JT2-VF2]
MKSYLAVAIQMTSVPNLEQNLAEAEKLIQMAVHQGAKLVGLPENFSFMGEVNDKLAQAEAIASASEKFLKQMAQRFQITILGGGFPIPANERGKVHNTAILVDPSGQEIIHYQKIHLFDVNVPDGNSYRESSTVVPGKNLPSMYFSQELGNIGVSICYDVRFPELYRHIADKGGDIIFVPAAFTGKDHWQVLLQARAIENTCYIIAPAQTGLNYAQRHTYGHAMIIDPWGVILADAGDKPGVAIAEINPYRLEQVRSQMPSLQHRVFT